MIELRKRVAEAARRLAASGLVAGTSGNVSARDGEHVAVTASGVVLADATDEQVSVVDLAGRTVDGDFAPTSELAMHLAIYERHGTSAVVHSHARMATALSTVLDEVPLIHYDMLALGGAVRVAPYATFGSDELAARVAQALDGRRAALMSNHGAVTIGDDLASAVRATELLEWICDVYWHARTLGEPRLLSDRQLEEVAETVRSLGYGTVKPG